MQKRLVGLMGFAFPVAAPAKLCTCPCDQDRRLPPGALASFIFLRKQLIPPDLLCLSLVLLLALGGLLQGLPDLSVSRIDRVSFLQCLVRVFGESALQVGHALSVQEPGLRLC